MKIEKISDTQVKFTLSHADLEERDIKLTELAAYGSEKTQRLFREMMEQALIVCDFEADNIPLMIEAMPISMDSIVIIVTKVTSESEVEQKFNMTPRTRDIGKFRPKEIIKTKNLTDEKYTIYSFEQLDDVSTVSAFLSSRFSGDNSLYKFENRYYLFLKTDKESINIKYNNLESILSEYGRKHVSTYLSQYYLEEHGEVIIASNAVNVMAKYLT